jgi:hypothetical protein
MMRLFYMLRWCIYLIRWLLFVAYGLVEFLSKPGSRLIVPVLAAAAAYLYRLPLDAAVKTYLFDVDWRHMPEPATLYTGAALGLFLTICIVVTLFPVHRGLLLFAVRFTFLAAIALAGAYAYREELDVALAANMPELGLQLRHMHMTAADAVLAFGLLLATCVYVTLSRLLVLLLGAFPPIVRPLRPMRALRVKNRRIRSVAVRIVVPKLPKRRVTPLIGPALSEPLNDEADAVTA